MGKGKFEDPETVRAIKRLTEEGLSQSKIADRLGLSKSKVQRTQKKLGIDSRSETAHTHAHDSCEESEPNQFDSKSELTQERTAKHIIDYVKFFESRTKHNPYDLSERDKAWAEGNYGKRWADGINMMISTTGLSPEALMVAIEDYEVDVSSSLEKFNRKFRDDD